MAEVVQDSGCSDLTGFAPLTHAFLSSHAENTFETAPPQQHLFFSHFENDNSSLSEDMSGKA